MKLYITKVDGIASDNLGKRPNRSRPAMSGSMPTHAWTTSSASTRKATKVRMWIEDTRTGKHVGGKAGTEP